MTKRTQRALAIAVLVMLLFTLNPELRGFLIFLDAISVEIFLTLLLLQSKDILRWLTVAVCLPAARRVGGWGWYSMPLPHRAMFKLHALWAAYATGQHAMLAAMIVTSVVALARYWAEALQATLT